MKEISKIFGLGRMAVENFVKIGEEGSPEGIEGHGRRRVVSIPEVLQTVPSAYLGVRHFSKRVAVSSATVVGHPFNIGYVIVKFRP